MNTSTSLLSFGKPVSSEHGRRFLELWWPQVRKFDPDVTLKIVHFPSGLRLPVTFLEITAQEEHIMQIGDYLQTKL